MNEGMWNITVRTPLMSPTQTSVSWQWVLR